jgi:hypothetical protein
MNGVRSMVVLAMLWSAPLQCSRQPDPTLDSFETPPDALYQLATRFKGEGDARAYRETLRYLSERYPNSRFAVRAKDELGEANDGGRK